MATQAIAHELALAERMSRLGTETAFEVLSKAKTLERQGRVWKVWRGLSAVQRGQFHGEPDGGAESD